MWRAQTFRKGRKILSVAQRHLAAEAGGTSAVPPPPPPKSRGFGLVKFVGLGLPLATGGVVGYAWYDKDFRKQLEDNVPYAKELLENVLPAQEVAAPRDTSNGANILPIQDNKQFPAPIFETKETLVQQPSSGTVGNLATEKQKEPKSEVVSVEEQLRRKQVEDRSDNAALEVVIDKMLESGQNWVAEAAKAQLDVAKATQNHSNLLKKAMDDSSDILHKDAEWEAVTIAYKEREIAAVRASELVDEAKKSMGKLKKILDEAKANKVTMKNSAILPASKKLSEFNKELSAAGAKVRQADGDAKVMLKYKDLVDKGKKQFQMELESLVPDVKPGRKGRKLSEEELNALIAHAHRRIEQLQKQIAEQLAMEHKRLMASLEMQKEENKSMTMSALNDERTRLLNEFELEKQILDVEFAAQMEVEVRKQLSRQAAAHSDHLKDVLAVQEQELSKDFDRKMNMKLLEEREKFQSETSGWISRLKGIETAVDARAANEKLARRAQDLWLACIALNSTILFGDEEETESLLALQPQLEAVVNSANKHPFVETVANTVPQVALNRGVYTESQLRDRFVKVSQVSRRLGLIQESRASMYQYLISFIHSFFTVRNVAAYSEKDMVSVEDMDNFELVANAQYWMEKGSLEMALRFMSQLTGESRNAAADWISEAKVLLETRQAAHTITAFASATGLAATF